MIALPFSDIFSNSGFLYVFAVVILIYLTLHNRIALYALALLGTYEWLPFIKIPIHDLNNYIFISFVLGCFFYIIASQKKLIKLPSTIFTFLVLFSFALLPGFLLSINNLKAGFFTVTFAPIFLFILAYQVLNDLNISRRVLGFAILGLSIQSVYLLLMEGGLIPQFSPPAFIPYIRGNIGVAFSASGSKFAGSLGVVLPVTLGLLLERKNNTSNYKNYVLGALVVIFVFTLFFTFMISGEHGRRGILAAAVGILPFIYLNKRYRFWGLLGVISVVLALFITKMYSLDILSIRFTRAIIYLPTLRLIGKNPLLGTGFGNFLTQFGALKGLNPALRNFGGGGHNIILNFSARSGILAGVTLLGFLGSIIVKGYKIFYSMSNTSLRYLSAGLYGTLIGGIALSMFTGWGVFSLYRYVSWWLCLAIFFSMPKFVEVNK